MAKAATKKVEDDIMKDAMERVEQENAAPAPARSKTKPKPAPAPKAPQQKRAMIAYVPLEDGDAPFTQWRGLKFKANVPREITDPDMIAAAKGNPWFSVDGKPPAKRGEQLPPRDTSEDVRSVPLVKGVKDVDPETGEELPNESVTPKAETDDYEDAS